MKAVIITGDGPEHRFVRKYLVEALAGHLAGIIIEKGGVKITTLQTVKKMIRRYNIFRIIERVTTKFVRKLLRYDQRQNNALNTVLGDMSNETTLPDSVSVIEAPSVNNNKCLKWLNSIKPDYLFIYGTGIVGSKVLSIPTELAMNLHTGISPFYRGSFCEFWPLYNKEPLLVGSTVHECTAETDGGNIFARISVKLVEHDTSFHAFAKSVKAGAGLYAEVADQLVNDKTLVFEKQDFTLGKEYRFKDKTFLHDLRMEVMLITGQLQRIIKASKNSPLPYPDNKQ